MLSLGIYKLHTTTQSYDWGSTRFFSDLRGEEWLKEHPLRELVIERYLKHQRGLKQEALSRLLVEEEGKVDSDEGEAALEAGVSLNQQRLQAVLAELQASGARRVLD